MATRGVRGSRKAVSFGPGALTFLNSLSPTFFSTDQDEVEDPEIKEYAHVTLDDLTRVETLGMGGFGRVELVSERYSE